MQKYQLDDLRIVQYNLQIKDTDKMVPEEIAESLERLCANAVVLNVGGIYAWYPSRVKYHHINEYLPAERPLLKEIIESCHKRGIRVIGRFDFSKTDDVVYLQRPEWFVQDQEGQPLSFGSKRMGEWSLLMSTCINGGYRNEEFAALVLEEAIKELDMDGIFFNAPRMEICYCENCKRKYRKLYGQELPEDSAQWRKDWATRCLKDNMTVLKKAVKKVNPSMPMILYYGTYQQGREALAENLDFRYATCDYICTEAQDILSAGIGSLPDIFKPTINMKLGQSVPGYPSPFGIIHSCPGMDWRHSGLPAAEYEFWMSQIPASGGLLWHSLTGFDATIADRRLLPVVARVNEKAKRASELMEDAVPHAEVLLLWNAGVSEQGLVRAMMNGHISFDLMDVWHVDSERMGRYGLVIVPDRFPLTAELVKMLMDYAQAGGSILIEKTDAQDMELLCDLMGIHEHAVCGKILAAAYGFAESEGSFLMTGLEGTTYIPVKGNVLYARKQEGAEALMTLVPPFAPPDGVGAPPERASMPVKHTDIPLLLEKKIGTGRVLSVCFGLSELIRTVGLEDNQVLFENCVRYSLSGRECTDGSRLPEGVFFYQWEGENSSFFHLVNGIGSRPLRNMHVCHRLNFTVMANRRAVRVYSALDQEAVEWEQIDGKLHICLETLRVWDMIAVVWE